MRPLSPTPERILTVGLPTSLVCYHAMMLLLTISYRAECVRCCRTSLNIPVVYIDIILL